MRVDKYYHDLLQVITEDDNLRIRKSDMVELERTEFLEFLTHLSLLEKRLEEKLEQLRNGHRKISS